MRIKGRIKEIIVTSTGEKIAPVDLEFAIQEDPLFEQVFVCGENRPFISAVLVLQPDLWKALCAEMELSADDPQTLHDRSMLRYLVKRVRRRQRFSFLRHSAVHCRCGRAIYR